MLLRDARGIHAVCGCMATRMSWQHKNKKNGHFERKEKNKMGQDYYSILELTKGASDTDIKKA